MNGEIICIKAFSRIWILPVFLVLSIIIASPANAALACNSCHTMPPLDSGGERNPATGAFKGNHQGHSGNSVASCVPCHGAAVSSYAASHSAPPPGSGAKPVIRLTQALHNYSISHTLASYNRGAFFNQTSVPPNPLGTCSNVNCHFETATPAWGTASFASPTDCDKCHGAPPSGASTGAAGSHAKHVLSYPGVANCQKCHPNNTTFQHATSAGNRPLNVSFAAAPNNGSGSYTGPLNDCLPSQNNVFGNCSATYCHGTTMVPNNGTNNTPTWGTASTGQCGACHGATATTPPLRGSHKTHAGSAEWYYPPSGPNNKIKGRALACTKCHKTGSSNHVNGNAEWSFNSISSPWLSGASYRGLSSGSVSAVPSSSYGQCSNLYCHSMVQTATGGPLTGLAGEYKTPTWGTLNDGRCGSCHSVDLQHAFSTGGLPLETPEIASGSHGKHLTALGLNAGIGPTPGGPARCAVCHNYGNSDDLLGCSNTCHVSQSTLHVNHQIEVRFAPRYDGGSAAYTGNPTPGSGFGGCTTTYCHSNGLASSPVYYTPTWGNIASGACGTCHGATAAASPASTPHGKHLASAYPYLFACDACHNGKVQVTANSTIQPAYANLTSHVNKLRDVKFNSGSPFGTYSSVNQSCRNLYCHSIGNLNVTAGALPAAYNSKIYTRQTWSGSLACNGCHGRSTADGMPDYTNGGAATTTANSHAKHVTSSSIACVQCHEKTTKSGTSIRNTIPGKHVNATTNDVFFNLSSLNISGSYITTRKRCYNTYCHSDGSKTAGPFVPYSSAAWGGSLTCAGCHKSTYASGNQLVTGSHSPHLKGAWGSSYTQIKCVRCHAVTATPSMTINDGTRHANSKVDIAFDSSSSAVNGYYNNSSAKPSKPYAKTPGSTYATCTNVYCHSSGQADGGAWPPVYRTPVWNNTASGKCSTCHGVNGSAEHGGFGMGLAFRLVSTGSHNKHLKQYTYGISSIDMRCAICHAYDKTQFVSSASTCGAVCHANTSQYHANYEINVNIANYFGATAAYNGTTRPGDGYSTCSTVYCHSNGASVATGTVPANSSPAWGSGAMACDGCHGNPPNYATGTPKANSHSIHAVHSVSDCSICHYGTTTNGTTITDLTQHVNKAYNVQAKPGYTFTYTYNAAGGSCTTVSCHGNAQWGTGSAGGTSCIECHGHSAGYEYEAGKFSQGKGSWRSHATHTQNDGDNAKGPNIACNGCHDTNNFPYFITGTDGNADGKYNLSETDVCNTCHSPLGTYDGVGNATYGAKANWTFGIYSSGLIRSGKEKWCASCHDDVPSVISSISAPNVVGDEDGATNYGTGWGYYKTGHGLSAGTYPASEAPAANRDCSGCHDYAVAHIDGAHRTYRAANDNYQAGYRLKHSMDIPRDSENADDFTLCFTCHSSDPYLVQTDYTTNFRNSTPMNGHWKHLLSMRPSNDWDSDWDGTVDSRISCAACHNVHGSPSPRMIRHGELISTPGTTDKVPALDFQYTPEGTYLKLMNSTGGKTRFIAGGSGTPVKNGICNMCHNDSYTYTRTPNDMYPPRISGVYGKVGSAVISTVFSKGVYTTTGSSGAVTADDFAFTDGDNGRTIIGVVHNAGDDVAKLTLSSNLDATNDLGVDGLAAITATSIYDAADLAMGTDMVTVSSDTTAPAAADLSPAHSATGIYTNSNLSLTLADTGSGIDWSTFSIQLTGSRGYSKTYTDTDTSIVAKTGNLLSFSVSINPDTDFNYDETITVSVNVSDLLGNAMTPPAWSFTTLSGGGPFTRTIHPSGMVSTGGFSTSGGDWDTVLDSNDGDASYATLCCTSSGFSFVVDMDNPTGLDSASIQSIKIKVYAKDTIPGAIDIGYKTGTNTVWMGSTALTTDYALYESGPFTTDSDGGALDIIDINNLQIEVKRNNSGGARLNITEVAVEITYGVVEGDTTPPVISNLSPANSASNVAIDSNLTFVLSDTAGGVDWSSFQIQLSGNKGYSKTYTDLDTAVVSKTGSMASYNVTVNPDVNFSTEEIITVTVNVNDRAGNPLTSPTWSFTTQAASTPQTLTIYPSGYNSDGGFIVYNGVSDPTWSFVLDDNDGDTDGVYWSTGGSAGQVFYVDMDDPSGLGSATIQKIAFYVRAKYVTLGGGLFESRPEMSGSVDIGYRTGSGETTVWRGAYTTVNDSAYDLISSIEYTTDSNGGALDLTDINNLQIAVKRLTSGGNQLRVTQIYAVVTYLP